MALRLVGISGSLRRHSYNAGLLRAAQAAMPEGTSLAIHSIAGVPLYNADVEAEGIPDAVTVLKDAVAEADGVLLVTPEYNNGVPGVFKNAIDWMSRPASDIPRVFGGKPVALIGASPGGFGTILSQNGWLPTLRTLGTELWTGGRLMVAKAGAVFDEEGNLVDDAIRERLTHFVAAFAESISESKK
ncbi:MAG: reductase [Sphingomonas bacterium]|jgi:chromate reductase|uniref:NADPH-dependent FMN reductase n=1 Tax=Sphingomonas bacterium TaxID=1895847 RepID=UPI0026307CF6|nr:NADPH-dependent FMN reductase [Sphingomonas bacterium]MDB5703950.1 reductase [Sphingomonas bacterium]